VNNNLEQMPRQKNVFGFLTKKNKSRSSISTEQGSNFTAFDPSVDNQAHANIKPTFRPGWRLLSFILTALFSSALISAWKMPDFRVSEIIFSGFSRIETQNIRALVDSVGKPIYLLQPDVLEDQIKKAYPELMNVQIALGLPASMKISAIERIPFASWKVLGQTLWIDTQGILIPARGTAEINISIEADSLPPVAQYFRDVKYTVDKAVYNKPMVKPMAISMTYFSVMKALDSSMLEAILTLSIWLPDKKIFLYEKTRGLGWNDTRGWKVFVGSDLSNLNQKMVLYETIFKELEKEKIHPIMISVEYLSAPYYRME
jgi:hypothetical protein